MPDRSREALHREREALPRTHVHALRKRSALPRSPEALLGGFVSRLHFRTVSAVSFFFRHAAVSGEHS